jgi:hypothetical protein
MSLTTDQVKHFLLRLYRIPEIFSARRLFPLPFFKRSTNSMYIPDRPILQTTQTLSS